MLIIYNYTVESQYSALIIQMNVTKIMFPYNGGHFEWQAAIGQINMPSHSYVVVSRAQKHKFLLA